MMRLFSLLMSLGCMGGALFYLFDKHPDVKEKIETWVDFRTVEVLQPHYQVENIIDTHQKILLKEKGRRVIETEQLLTPFLFLEVKYLLKDKTKEGVILWDLSDGEMLLNTKTWEKTHGFADCIVSNIQGLEMELLHVLADKGSAVDKETLASKLHIEVSFVDKILHSCERKQFVIPVHQNKYRMHLEKPKFTTLPETKISTQLAIISSKKEGCLPKQFHPYQIKRGALHLFGKHFSIRSAKMVYVPIYKILVQDYEGASHAFYFNALTAKEFPGGALL